MNVGKKLRSNWRVTDHQNRYLHDPLFIKETQSAELAKFAVPGLRIYFLGFLVAAVNIVLAGFFSATGQALASSLIAVSRGIIVISLMAFMLSKLFGVTGVWMAFPVTEVVTFGIAMGIQGVSKRKE